MLNLYAKSASAESNTNTSVHKSNMDTLGRYKYHSITSVSTQFLPYVHGFYTKISLLARTSNRAYAMKSP